MSNRASWVGPERLRNSWNFQDLGGKMVIFGGQKSFWTKITFLPPKITFLPNFLDHPLIEAKM